MTVDVISFAADATFREIQQCMKERRFSGTPIVENGNVIGMVSIDDIITAFDRGWIDRPVAEHMTREVIMVAQNYSVIAASNIFNKYRFGRLPVVEDTHSTKLMGLITFSDILSHLLLAVNKIAERVERQEAQMTTSMRAAARDALRYELAPDNFELAGIASTSIKKELKTRGLPAALLRRIAVICYEAEMNVIIHSLGGYMEVQVQEDRVVIQVVDEGPGIPDLERALQEGYTTATEKIRALGFGAGMGLCNMKRCADEFRIHSSMESGTELEAVVLLESQETNET